MGEGRRGCGWHAGSATASQALHEHDLADGRRRRQHLPHREPRLRVRALVFPHALFISQISLLQLHFNFKFLSAAAVVIFEFTVVEFDVWL